MRGEIVYSLGVLPEFKEAIKETCSSSEEKFRNINVVLSDENYKVVRYDKNFLALDLIPTIGLLRSVVVNKENKVVSFAPPKSLHSDTFIKKYPEKTDCIVAEEFVEGTMINVFWDPCIGMGGAWEIATRNKVGANSTFYNNKNGKTFRKMFAECCNKTGLDYDALNRNYCYSFVMQHPENRIVVPFASMELYLIQVCDIVNTENGTCNVMIQDINSIKIDEIWKNTKIKFPEIYHDWNRYKDLIETYASNNTSYSIVGVILRNVKTNERCKIRNPTYEEVRQLRGNQPKLQYQYLSLRKEGKVCDFLKFYPEHKKDFSSFRDQVHLFTNTLFQNYISCYIRKEKPLIEFPDQYRRHMFALHKKYIDELKEKNLHVTNMIVIEYVNTMHSAKLMFCLNFHTRKRCVDFIKSENDE
jgi:hypothetical protein